MRRGASLKSHSRSDAKSVRSLRSLTRYDSRLDTQSLPGRRKNSAHASQRTAAAIGDTALVRVAARAGRPLKSPHDSMSTTMAATTAVMIDAEIGGNGALLGAQMRGDSERAARKRLCTFGKCCERPLPVRREYSRGMFADNTFDVLLKFTTCIGGLPVRYAPSTAGAKSEEKAMIIEVKSASSINGGGGGTPSIGSAPSLRDARRRPKHRAPRSRHDLGGGGGDASRLPQITVSDNERERRPPIDVGVCSVEYARMKIEHCFTFFR